MSSDVDQTPSEKNCSVPPGPEATSDLTYVPDWTEMLPQTETGSIDSAVGSAITSTIMGGPPPVWGVKKTFPPNRMCVPATVAVPHVSGLLAQSAITATTKYGVFGFSVAE